MPNETPYDEESLARLAVAGDRDALSQLLQQVAPGLRISLEHEIGAGFRAHLDPEDVLQVSFLECFLQISRFEFRGNRSFEKWTRQICRHNLLDAIRSLERMSELPPEKRIPIHSEMDSSWALWEAIGSSTGSPSRQAMTEEIHLRLRDVISQLPRDYCQVITLYDLQGKSVHEVASAMNRSTGAVFMLRARALDLLRHCLGSPSRM